jgi:hypothetical protein
MWERFMTKPLVDKGIFRRVGDCPTLALFVIAVREDVLENIKDYQNNFRYKLIERQIASKYPKY